MPKCRCLLRKVKQIPDQDIHQNMEIVGEKILISAGSSENQVKQLQCQQLQ
jgi:hypothetical protein